MGQSLSWVPFDERHLTLGKAAKQQPLLPLSERQTVDALDVDCMCYLGQQIVEVSEVPTTCATVADPVGPLLLDLVYKGAQLGLALIHHLVHGLVHVVDQGIHLVEQLAEIEAGVVPKVGQVEAGVARGGAKRRLIHYEG